MRIPAHVGVGVLGAAVLLAGRVSAQEQTSNAQRRWEWFYQQRAYPFNAIPAGALERARVQLSGMVRGGLLGTANFNVPEPIRGTQWQTIGPRAIPASGTVTGRLTAIAVHPTNSNILYIGGAQGGVWKTTNGGVNWTPLTDRECSLAMGSIALDPVNPEIVYAATGEQHFSADSYYGCGVLRSTDGGATWTRLGATTFVRSRISRIVIIPSTAGLVASTTIFAASDNGLWRSSNGGATWTLVRSGIITDLVLDPSNDRVLYSAVRTQGVFRSANLGTTWEALGPGFPTASVGRINLALAPTAPRTLYASVHNVTANTLLGIWKSTDAGVSWTQLLAAGASCGTQCWYDMFIAVHPTNENQLYFGGVALYRSVDGGQTFQNIGANIHVDQHYVTFDPQNPQRMYIGNDGGIYRSDNAGTNWTSLNAGLELTQFYAGISLHPSERTIVLGGTQDNGTLRFNNSPTWSVVIGGDGGFTAIHPDNPAIQYGETQWTTTSATSGPRRSDGGGFARKVNGIVTTEPALFIPPLVMDPTDPQVLYFGTNRLYRTADNAESWTPISPVLGATGVIGAIAPSASDPATIYLGTTIGQVHVTNNGGTLWNLRNTGLPQRVITDLSVDRRDARTAYVTVSGFGTGHVFRTTDGGQTWSNASGNLPDVPVNAVITDPVSRAIVMLGTDVGVFISADSGGSWTPLVDGLPNVAIYDIAYNPATATLIAATHGRGMFQLQLDRALTLAVVPGRRKVTLLESAASARADSAAVVLSGTGAAAASWSATHGRAGWLTLTAATGAAGGKVKWTRNVAGLAPGIYVDTITVVSGGAIDSPARLVDTLVVEPAVATLAVTPTVRRDSVSAGDAAIRMDSAVVALPGLAGSQSAWTAAPRKGVWISMITASGTGTGMARWRRTPASLSIGVYVDTIVVNAPGTIGSPGLVVDSLVVLPLLSFAPSAQRDSLVSGTSAQSQVTQQLTIGGDPGGTVSWTVTHGRASWLTLTTTSGRGSGPISWTRTAANLRDGMHVDTITVTAGAVRRMFIDTLVVTAPAVTRTCVTDHFLGTPCLDATQSRWLDLAGNADGQLNLGDLVAFLNRPAFAAPPSAPRRRREP